MALLSYALSITTTTTAGNAATPSHTGSNPTASLHCPPVNTNDTPVRSSVQAACRLVVNPPRERPRAWAACPPFFLTLRPHVGGSSQWSNR